MVKSSVEYIEKDVEAADIDEEEEKQSMAWGLAAILKLSVPVGTTLFVLLFLNSVVGRISIENLYYPLFVIGTLLFILSTIYITEILEIYREHTTVPTSMRANLQRLIAEWRISIAFLVAAIFYLALVPIIGFFPASVIGMVGIMLLGGYRNWKTIGITTVVILSLIYVLFIVIANLPAPEGPLGI